MPTVRALRCARGRFTQVTHKLRTCVSPAVRTTLLLLLRVNSTRGMHNCHSRAHVREPGFRSSFVSDLVRVGCLSIHFLPLARRSKSLLRDAKAEKPKSRLTPRSS
jgi:hypothetical protein